MPKKVTAEFVRNRRFKIVLVFLSYTFIKIAKQFSELEYCRLYRYNLNQPKINKILIFYFMQNIFIKKHDTIQKF